jgi:transcriptional regulator PpsR
LAQRATEEQVRDEPIDRWLGRSSVEIETFLGNTAQHGAARQFATIVRGEFGSIEEVEASAVFVADPEHPCFGLTIRANGRKAAAKVLGEHELPRSVQQMTGLVGQVPLKNLVRETTDLIERLCIEAALELVGDNRASAAEMLGLSRQSLYVKLRRYGLGDLGGDGDE